MILIRSLFIYSCLLAKNQLTNIKRGMYVFYRHCLCLIRRQLLGISLRGRESTFEHDCVKVFTKKYPLPVFLVGFFFN